MLYLKHRLRYAPARRPGRLPWKKTAPGRGTDGEGPGKERGTVTPQATRSTAVILVPLGRRRRPAERMGSASQTGGSREGRPHHPAGEAAARPGAAGGWVAAGLRRVPRPGVLSSAATLCGVLPYLNMHPFFPANWSLSSNSCVLSRLIPLGHMLFFLTH